MYIGEDGIMSRFYRAVKKIVAETSSEYDELDMKEYNAIQKIKGMVVLTDLLIADEEAE